MQPCARRFRPRSQHHGAALCRRPVPPPPPWRVRSWRSMPRRTQASKGASYKVSHRLAPAPPAAARPKGRALLPEGAVEETCQTGEFLDIATSVAMCVVDPDRERPVLIDDERSET